MLDFRTPKIEKMEDKTYFSIGAVDLHRHKELVVSASFLKNVYDEDLYQVLSMGSMPIDDELQYIFNLGNAFHCYCLEPREFEKRFYVADYENQFESKTRMYINTIDFDFVIKCYNNIKIKYPYMLEESEWNEVVILTNFNGVPYRCKIDKLVETDNEIEIIDLKSIWFDFYGKKYRRKSDNIRWGLVNYIKELNYDLGGYAYTKAVISYLESKGVSKMVKFSLLLASKETFAVKKVIFSQEMMESGEKKFNNIFPEIQSFYTNGLSSVEQDEYI